MANEEKQVVELGELLRILRKRHRLVLAIVLLVVVVTLLTNRRDPPIYTAVSKVLSKQPLVRTLFDQGQHPLATVSLETQAKLVNSAPVAERAAKRMTKGHLKVSAADIARSVQADMEPPDLLRIAARAPDPRTALAIANNVAYAFVDVTRENTREEATSARRFLENQLTRMRRELQSAEKNLERFRQQEGINDIDEEIKAHQSRYYEFESARTTLEGDMYVSRAQIATLQRRLTHEHESKTITRITDSPVFTALKEQMVQLQTQLVLAQIRYSPTHPQVVSLQAQEEQLRESIARMANKTISIQEKTPNPAYQETRRARAGEESKAVSMEARTQALENLLHNERDALKQLTGKASDFRRRQRAVTTLETGLNSLLDKLLTAKLNEAVQSTDVSVADLATDASAPANSSTRRIALALILGLVGAVIVALTIEYLDNTLRTPDEVTQFLQLTTLGTIPLRTNPQGALVTVSEPRSSVSEAYRILRSNLKFTSLDQPMHVIVVTSSVPQEGKTITSANLAVVLAQADQQVLLVDADLRRPHLHVLFGVSNQVGLTSVLVGDADLEQAIVPTSVDNLRFLPCGPRPPNPTELIDSERMNKLIEQLHAKADIVLFDTTPTFGVADAVLLSARTDGVLYVVEAGKVARTLVREAHRLIERARGKLLGIVLNKVRISGDGYYYYRYYRYYHRYYRDAQQEQEQAPVERS